MEPITPFFFETSPPAAQTSPLFRLPLEIRNGIYDILLQGSRFMCSDGGLLLEVVYGESDHTCWKSLYLPNFILSCKLFLAEFMEQFYLKAQIIGHWSESIPYARTQQSPFRLVTLYRVQKLNLELPLELTYELDHDNHTCTVLPEKDEQGRGVPRIRISPHMTIESWNLCTCPPSWKFSRGEGEFRGEFDYTWSPQHLIEHLRNREYRIKDIRMSTKAGVDINYLVRAWIIDFSALEGLGSAFERVEFCIEYSVRNDSTGFDDYYVRNMVTQYAVLQKELMRVAKRLVGGKDDGSGWIVQDGLEMREYLICEVYSTWEKAWHNTHSVKEWHVVVGQNKAEAGSRELSVKGLCAWMQEEGNLGEEEWIKYERVPNETEEDGEYTFVGRSMRRNKDGDLEEAQRLDSLMTVGPQACTCPYSEHAGWGLI